MNRILHAGGDATGQELIRHLIGRLGPHVVLKEYETAADLWIEDGRCCGVWTKDSRGKTFLRKADFVVGEDGGFLSFRFPDGTDREAFEKAQLLLEGMIVSLDTIERDYKGYLKVTTNKI